MSEQEDGSEAGVLLSREDRAEAARLLKLIAGNAAQPGVCDIASDAIGGPAHARDLARRWRLSRKLRTNFFSPSITGEPAYEMLLTLYVAEGDATPMTTKQIIQDADIASTTALRWLDYLVDQNMVERTPSPKDRRVVLVTLTGHARNLLDGYFTAIIQNGLAC